MASSAEDVYEVEKILNHRLAKRGVSMKTHLRVATMTDFSRLEFC